MRRWVSAGDACAFPPCRRHDKSAAGRTRVSRSRVRHAQRSTNAITVAAANNFEILAIGQPAIGPDGRPGPARHSARGRSALAAPPRVQFQHSGRSQCAVARYRLERKHAVIVSYQRSICRLPICRTEASCTQLLRRFWNLVGDNHFPRQVRQLRDRLLETTTLCDSIPQFSHPLE
jgi:hypothetical protein